MAVALVVVALAACGGGNVSSAEGEPEFRADASEIPPEAGTFDGLPEGANPHREIKVNRLGLAFPGRPGLARQVLATTGVTISNQEFDALLIDAEEFARVPSQQQEALVASWTQMLEDGTVLVLDSNGGDSGQQAVGALSLQIVGMEFPSDVVLVFYIGGGASFATPLGNQPGGAPIQEGNQLVRLPSLLGFDGTPTGTGG